MFKKVLSSVLLSALCWAHGEGVNERVEIELTSSSELTATTSTMHFQLADVEEHRPVTDVDLKITHEKLLHVFIFDKGLGEFQHVHPEFKDGEWSVEATFAKNGEYWMYAQGQLTDDEDFISNTPLVVKEGSEANPAPPVLTDVRTGNDGSSIITMTNTRFRKGREAMPNITFSRNDGTEPSIEPYLGEKAHIVITPTDADTLIHTHPMDHGVPNQVMLHVTFPEAGFYRLWVQFMDGGTLRTVPLSVEVFE